MRVGTLAFLGNTASLPYNPEDRISGVVGEAPASSRDHRPVSKDPGFGSVLVRIKYSDDTRTKSQRRYVRSSVSRDENSTDPKCS